MQLKSHLADYYGFRIKKTFIAESYNSTLQACIRSSSFVVAYTFHSRRDGVLVTADAFCMRPQNGDPSPKK